MSPDPLASHWLAAIARPDICAALESIYSAAAAAIAQRGPACWASGRCCNFDAHGHRLYTTGLETAYTIAALGTPALRAGSPASGTPTLRGGSSSSSSTPPPLHSSTPPLSLPQLQLARSKGGCPFQIENLCSVHTIKPLGCRLYFCDRTAQQWQQDLSEQLLARLRALHNDFNIEYRYGEWRDMLARFAH